MVIGKKTITTFDEEQISIILSVPTIKFNHKDRPEFQKELRKRVNSYFKDNGISKYANAEMKLKTLFMITLYFLPFILMLTGVVNTSAGVMGMWFIMGFGVAGIGLSIMHDANHGAYSSDKRVNKVVGYILNFMGGFPANWRMQHNVLHHSFTNIEGYDEDIEKGDIIRFSPNQRRLAGHKYQVYYAPILYSLLTIYWVLFKDIEQLIRYNKMGLLEGQNMTFGKALMEIIFNKIWYFALTLVLPIMIVDVPTYVIVSGFIMMLAMSGLILALIFQTAHVIEETEFFVAGSEASVEDNFAIHQMKTTSNYANNSYWFSWFVGGLNFQIEHHLFPNICHVHYPQISKIVRATAEEHGVVYNSHATFWQAIVSHFSILNKLGTGKL